MTNLLSALYARLFGPTISAVPVQAIKQIVQIDEQRKYLADKLAEARVRHGREFRWGSRLERE